MKIVTRDGWDARRPETTTTLKPASIKELVFHYSAGDSDEQADHANCAARVRGIQKFHIDTRGWADIAYSFLVCKHGYVFEGRGWNVRTAATGDANSYTLAVCFLGDDTDNRDDVTVVGRKALVEIAREFRHRYPHALRFGGHRDHMPTPCPGDEIYRYINSATFRRLVALDDQKRLAELRRWILKRRLELGWSWAQIKKTANFKEYRRLGGK